MNKDSGYKEYSEKQYKNWVEQERQKMVKEWTKHRKETEEIRKKETLAGAVEMYMEGMAPNPRGYYTVYTSNGSIDQAHISEVRELLNAEPGRIAEDSQDAIKSFMIGLDNITKLLRRCGKRRESTVDEFIAEVIAETGEFNLPNIEIDTESLYEIVPLEFKESIKKNPHSHVVGKANAASNQNMTHMLGGNFWGKV